MHATDIIKPDFCPLKIVFKYKNNLSFREDQYHPEERLLTFRIGNYLEDMVLDLLEAEKPKPMILRLKDIVIAGNPDGKKGKTIIEVKTIKKDEYDKLTSPKPEHIQQVNFYLYLNKYFNIYDNACIIYVPKQESKPTIKIYDVPIIPKLHERYNIVIGYLKHYLTTGEVKPIKCDVWKAKNCPFASICPYKYNGGNQNGV